MESLTVYMNNLPDAETTKIKINKRQLERNYKRLQTKLLDIYVDEFVSKGKAPDPEKVFEKQKKGMSPGDTEFYNLVLDAVDGQYLEIWNNEVAEVRPKSYVKARTTENQLRLENSKRSFYQSNIKDLSPEQ